MTVHPGTLMSIDRFLDWCAGQEGRYELAGGVLTPMMTPTTLPHARISLRLGIALETALASKGLDVSIGQRGVITGPSYRVPDVLVELPDTTDTSVTAARPLIIAEVLSGSTKAVDFGWKVREYLDLPTLAAYVIVSQSRPEAWIWERDADGNWPNAPTYLQAGDAISIHDPPVMIPLDSLFVGIPYEDANTP